MRNPYSIGDQLSFTHKVIPEDAARFESGEVHPVYSTFSVARDAEWSGRLFVLEMKEEDEEGIGTSITVNHSSPALIGQDVVFTATLEEINRNEVVTSYEARVGQRIIATGRQTQKVIKKEKLEKLFSSLE